MILLNDVTLLITHYNRSASLERLLKSFEDIQVSFEEVIVSDDCSKPEHLLRLRQLSEHYGYKLVEAEKNSGLGNNINKGQDQVKTPYTLYVQEDFIVKPLFAKRIITALDFLKRDPGLDFVRFYAYFKYPYLTPFGDGFSEMVFNPLNVLKSYKKFYFYSDHPHLRRSDFLSRFDRYRENLNPEKAEFRMMMNVLQKKARALFYDNFQELFEQKNSAEEPSTLKRNVFRNSDNMFMRSLRHLYRHIRFNAELLLTGRSGG